MIAITDAIMWRCSLPVSHGETSDADGTYVRRWVPGLAGLATRWIHQPWNAPPSELARGGGHLGENDPRPIIDHAAVRNEALAAFQSLKG